MEKISFALGVCCLISLSFGCTIDLEYGARATDKSENEMDHRKIYYSEVVVFGQIKKNVTGNYPMNDKEGVYSVEFDVICTYKGGPVPETIVIAGMGKLDSCIPFLSINVLDLTSNHFTMSEWSPNVRTKKETIFIVSAYIFCTERFESFLRDSVWNDTLIVCSRICRLLQMYFHGYVFSSPY